MCGRYAFYQRPSDIRRQLEDANMPVNECPGDDECRQTYNFPPGAFGVVYRADVPDHGAGPSRKHAKKHAEEEGDGQTELITNKTDADIDEPDSSQQLKETPYKLQSMKWGLIPSWTKRSPDYSAMLRTINCRDDSLLENKGIWNVPKRRKRCIVLCQGFYEWLKKNNGKDKMPHYIKRKDGQLLCLAGLWDCVKYEDSDEKHYTYSIITTDANKQMSFLHDRMPVILEMGSDATKSWLDPGHYEWTTELQSLMKPFDGELDIYPVNKDVGKVGNNSPSFIVPLDSAANKNNIANFFSNQKKLAKNVEATSDNNKTEEDVQGEEIKTKGEQEEMHRTTRDEIIASSAALPSSPRGIKREHTDEGFGSGTVLDKNSLKSQLDDSTMHASPPKPVKKMKSAISNGSKGKSASPSKAAQGTQKITKFFGK